MLFAANIVVCPNCKTQFPHEKINGLSLVATISDIDARKRTHARLLLNDLERLDVTRPEYEAIRKKVLDTLNDFNRDVQIILGLGDDLE